MDLDFFYKILLKKGLVILDDYWVLLLNRLIIIR